MKPPASAPLLTGAKLAVTALVTWLILRGIGLRMADIRAIDLESFDVDFLLVGLSTGVLLGAFAFSAWLWRGLVGVLGGEPVPVLRAVAMVLVANLGRYIPGKVFQLAGLAMLGKREGIPPALSATAAVVGQTLHLGAAALIGGGLLIQSGLVPPRWALLALVVTLGTVGVLSWTGRIRRFLGWVVRLGSRGDGGTAAPLPSRSFLPWLGGYVLNWLLLGMAFYLMVLGLGVEIDPATATTAFAAAYLIGYLALFAPAGIGVREGFLVAFLAPALGSGAALTVATAQRIWMTGAEVVGAAAAWPAVGPPPAASPSDRGAG